MRRLSRKQDGWQVEAWAWWFYLTDKLPTRLYRRLPPRLR